MMTTKTTHSTGLFGSMSTKIAAVVATTVLGSTALVACGANEDPTATNDGNDSTVAVGSANFPESEIIGQLYTQVLQNAGVNANFQGGIGARDVYLAALQKGSIDLVPEYSGNAVQYYAKGKPEEADLGPGTEPKEVLSTLDKVLPEGISAGEAAPAESRDSYRVMPDFAAQHHLTSLSDLAAFAENNTIKLAGNPELEARPYGPEGLEKVYDVPKSKIEFQPISDGGGPLTVNALKDGTVNMADIYTTSPVLDRSGNEVSVVELKDPKRLILAQQVIPLMRTDSLNDKAKDALKKVQEKLTTDDLKQMNLRNSGKEKAEPKQIAHDWLKDKGLVS